MAVATKFTERETRRVLRRPFPSLAWFVQLRWFGYTGALALTLTSERWGHLAFGSYGVVLLLAIGLSSNLAAHVWWRDRLETQRSLLAFLALDVFLLSLGLMLTGGLANPFALVYLVPVAIGAVTLPRRSLLVLLGEALMAVLLLAWVHRPLRADHEHLVDHGHHAAALAEGAALGLEPSQHAALHVTNAWSVLLLIGVVLVTLVRRALREREAQIEQLEEERERTAQLVEVSTLAASAAHALGSPLSTIAVIARELERALEADPSLEAHLEDVRAIGEQVERCRRVLDNLANDARTGSEPKREMALLELCQAAVREVRDPEIVELRVTDGETRSVVPRRSLTQVLSSLLENAREAAPAARVRLEARRQHDAWLIEVHDAGRSPPAEALARMGREPMPSRPFGMGIGLFLGRAILERLGGKLEIRAGAGGTTAVLTVPITQPVASSAALRSTWE